MAKFTAEQLLNHLYSKRLPKVYREADIETGYCLKRFLQAMIEGGFSETISLADGITDLTDPLKCPDQYFPILFESFGYTYSPDIPMKYQRKILQNHGELWQKRGTIEYINIISKILTGYDCEVAFERTQDESNVRVLNITIYVDSSEEDIVHNNYANLVKEFVSKGYIPFYLDVTTNTVVDTVDVNVSIQYISAFVEAEGTIDLSPIEEVTDTVYATSLSPTLEKEPFTKFNILGYSKIVPKYLTNNILNPNTSENNVSKTWLAEGVNTRATFDLMTDYLYVPYGSKLYFKLQVSTYAPPTMSVFVYSSEYEYLGVKSVSYASFSNGETVLDLSDILISSLVENDYYIQLGILDNEGVGSSAIHKLVSVWVEDEPYAEYSATTRFKFDNEYYKNGDLIPSYTVELNDANGLIGFPYCSDDDLFKYPAYDVGGYFTVTQKGVNGVTFYTDCLPTYKDGFLYVLSFAYNTSTTEDSLRDVPIVTALLTNGKGSFKEITLKNVSKGYNENINGYVCEYNFFIPLGYYPIRVKYVLTDYVPKGISISFGNVRCFECNSYSDEPLRDAEFQPYVLATDDLNVFENNLTVGIDGIELLSYNDSDGNAIVRDSFDVLTGEITHRVGVHKDSNGNPISTYALPTPYTEKVSQDLNGEVEGKQLMTYRGKTYISMSYHIPYSIYADLGGTDKHSCVEFATKIIK